jgi:hypothetical protein
MLKDFAQKGVTQILTSHYAGEINTYNLEFAAGLVWVDSDGDGFNAYSKTLAKQNYASGEGRIDCIFIAILISIIPIVLREQNGSEKIPIGIVSGNKDESYDTLIDMLKEYQQFDIVEWPYDKSIRNLMYSRLDAVHVLSDDFSDKIQKGEYKNILDAYASVSSPHLLLKKVN